MIVADFRFIEKELVTLVINLDGQQIYGYIKNEDLAWEKIQNASEAVFLNEEVKVKFLYEERHRFYFDLKWQQTDLYPKELFNMDIDELLSSLNIQENKFIAKVSILYDKNNKKDGDAIQGAIATNFIAQSDIDKNIQLIDKYTGANITAFVKNKYAYGLEDGKYYKFTIDVAPTEKRIKEHRPYMFTAQLDGGAIVIPDPYKEQVERSFKENKTPKSNRESASYLKEIGADMYTDRDRMFYELLQNADDASSKRGVKVMVQIKDNYLIFTHDGLSFSRQDFRSIVSTANSTKRLDCKKTGYKGIGFKSVFTDSEKVFIKTGGFFFLFNKKAEIFNDFREFYRYVNPLYTEEQLIEFFEENREYENEFEKVDHLPWQLLPFWVNECPDTLRGTTFMRNCNVAIALEMDATADKYRDIIKGIIQKPRFMLFLRNTLRIQFEDKKWEILSIAKQENNETGVVSLKNSFADTEEEVSYIVREGSEVLVSNEYFKECGIPVIKECKKLGNREKWNIYHLVDDTKIPITSIPERIIAADTTTLSYAFMLNDEGKVTPIPDKTPSLYAYLPMEDRRYLFPFFINADFELSSNRQNAKQVSVWNEFLFYNIGKNIVSWVSTLANMDSPEYLNLLPNSFFVEDLEEGKKDRLAIQFNRGYKEALLSTAFIKNDKGNVVLQNEICIDESGFAKVIDPENFCNLWNIDKRLVSNTIDDSTLHNIEIFTSIEHLQNSFIIEELTKSENRLKFLLYWYRINSTKKNEILRHIVSLPKNKKNLLDQIKYIPGFVCGTKCLSFAKLLKSSKYILRIKDMEDICSIMNKLGFVLMDDFVCSHPFYEILKEDVEAYKQHIFDLINQATSKQANTLTPNEKAILFKHFCNSKYGIKSELINNWKIFSNQDGTICALSELTHIDNALYGGIVSQYVINDEEYNNAGKFTFYDNHQIFNVNIV